MATAVVGGLALAVALCAVSCIEVRDDSVDGPQGDTDLAVTATTEPPAFFEGSSQVAILTAEATGGTPPYIYRWDQNGGPEVELGAVTSATLTVEGISDVGEYTFRVVVTDAASFEMNDFVDVEVLAAVTADAPEYAIVGEPVGLSADVSSEVADSTILWEVTQGTATLNDPASATPMLTTLAGETVHLRLMVTLPGADAGSAATREFEVVSVFDLHPQVQIATNFGDFVIELDGATTPRHMVNFLLYVDDGFYEGLLFHRNVCSENAETGECDPFVLQGGGYRRVDGELELVEPTRDPVSKENEDSPSNGTLYSVALALSGGNSDSGTTQLFINLSTENGFLDDQGFTVFGQVVEGTDVVDAIVAMPRVENTINPGEVSLPAEDVIMESVMRVNP